MSDDTFYLGSAQSISLKASTNGVTPCIKRLSTRTFVRSTAESFGKKGTGNLIIQGENLAVLHELVRKYSGKVRCIYIDPPYNNQERHLHYEDALDHTTWLNSVTARLRVLAELLTLDGSLWVSIDDREVHYLKIAADTIFGRDNFVQTIVWQQRTTRENRKVFSNNHEYILVYAKNAQAFKKSRNGLPATDAIRQRYKNPDNDPRGPWQSISANVQAGHATPSQFYSLTGPSGKKHAPPQGRCWVYSKKRMEEEVAKNNIWFGRKGDGVPRIKRFLTAAAECVTPDTLWLADHVGTNDAAKKHILQLFPRMKVFDTPKPESLISRIVALASNPGDIVLDAYGGCGTTAAVAHKMQRRYLVIEQGRHAVTHCANRLRSVVEGEQGGISRSVGWKRGGGFDFIRLV